MSEWKTAKLEDVAEVFGGGTPSRQESRFFGGSIAWATPTDVTALGGLYISKTRETITNEGLHNSSAKLMPAGTVLLTSRATIGFTAIALVPICTNQGFVNFVCGPDLVPEYLAYWLRTQKAKLIQHAGGTTFKEIARGVVRKFEISFPGVPEQRRLVDILTRAESIVRLRREALKKTQEIIPALFFNLFGDPTTNPKGWPISCLDKTTSIIVPTRDKPRSFSGNIPWVTIPDLTSIFVFTAKNKLTHEEARNVGNRLMPKGTVLLSCAGTLGKIGILTVEAYANQQLYGLVPIQESLTSEYLAVALQLKGDRFYRGLAGTSTLGFFSKARALSIEIPVPPIQKQLDFSQKLNRLISIQSQAIRAQATAEVTFQSLLHRAFAGEL
jgi:type I restriction enzyme S subunit